VIFDPPGNHGANNMSMINSVYELLGKLASFVWRQREPDFVCGDCERADRCALPPSKTCIVRAAQIARGDWKAKRRARLIIG